MKWILGLIAIFVGLYVLALAGIYMMQRSLLYFPPDAYLSPTDVNVPMEEVKNTEGDIVSWWSPPLNPEGKVVMVFHGNGSAIYSNHHIFRDLITAGHGVLSVGYPGYPGQGGTPSQAHLISAAKAQYEWLLRQGISPDHIVFYGTSIGSGVAAQLSTSYAPSLFIADAAFDSVEAVGAKAMSFLPVKLLLKDRYQSDDALRGQSFPLIWIHGTADRVVPIRFGQALFDIYNGPKTAHIIDGGQHTNLWILGGREIVLEALAVDMPDMTPSSESLD